MINEDDIEAFESCADDPASRPRDVRIQEVTAKMAELFYGPPSVQDLVEAMEAVALNQLDLKDLYLVATDVYAFIDRERNK